MPYIQVPFQSFSDVLFWALPRSFTRPTNQKNVMAIMIVGMRLAELIKLIVPPPIPYSIHNPEAVLVIMP